MISIEFRAGGLAVRCERASFSAEPRWFMVAGELKEEIPESEVSPEFVRACQIVFEGPDR